MSAIHPIHLKIILCLLIDYKTVSIILILVVQKLMMKFSSFDLARLLDQAFEFLRCSVILL